MLLSPWRPMSAWYWICALLSGATNNLRSTQIKDSSPSRNPCRQHSHGLFQWRNQHVSKKWRSMWLSHGMRTTVYPRICIAWVRGLASEGVVASTFGFFKWSRADWAVPLPCKSQSCLAWSQANPYEPFVSCSQIRSWSF